MPIVKPVVVQPGNATRTAAVDQSAGSMSPGSAALRARSTRHFWWKRLRPGLRVVTNLGWLTLAGAVVFLVLAVVTGWQEFGVAAVALLAGLITAALFLVGRSQFAVQVNLATSRVVTGEPATGGVVVRNVSQHRLLPVRMELPVGGGVGVLAIPGLAAGRSHEQLFEIPTDRRAVIVVGPARSVRGDAFGLLRRVVRWTEPERLYVHPRTVQLHGAAPGAIHDLDGQPTKDLSNSDISLHALRDYVAGDDRRFVHWKASAKAGTLLVRQFEQTRRSHLAITLPVRREHYAGVAEFELAISVGASLAVQSIRDQREVSVVTERRTFRFAGASQLLDRFSELKLADAAPDLVTAAHFTAVSVPGASVAILLCGSLPTPVQIRSAGAFFASSVRVIAVRVVPGDQPTMRTIGAVTVLTVGELGELGRALRKARA